MSKLLESPTEMVVDLVNRDGIEVVARRHKVSRYKLWRWIREQGYISKQLYIKRDPMREVRNEQ